MKNRILRGFRAHIVAIAFVLAMGIAILAAPSAFALTIVRVDGTGGSASPAGQGNGWGSNAYLYLQDGLTRAQAIIDQQIDTSVQIWVRGATGAGLTYKPDQGAGLTSGTRAYSFGLRLDVKVYGGFDTSHTTVSQRNPTLYVTILSGDIGAANDYSDNSYHVVTASNGSMTDDNTLLDGFTVTKGNGNGIGANSGGGGITIDTASPRIDRCLITANLAGAGSFVNSYGAGVFAAGSAAVFTRCVVSGNQNNSDSLYGGGFGIRGGSLRLIDCQIIGNRAAHGGGVATKDGSSVEIVNCLIAKNTIDASSNASPYGGGISIDRSGDAVIMNTTIVDNTAGRGGGIAQFSESGNTSTMYNVIVWDNHATDFAPEIYLSAGTMAISYSDIRDRNSAGVSGSPSYGSGVIGENVTAHDPDFQNASLDDYRLTCGSPCINVGDPNSVTTFFPVDEYDLDSNSNSTTEPTPDLDLMPRAVGVLDMGAYEKPAPCCEGDTDADNRVDVIDLLAVINAWGTCGSPCPADVSPTPCGNGVVNVSDLLWVINHWGTCTGCGPIGDPPSEKTPESYADCQELCDGLTGDDWLRCMQSCFQLLCEQGQTEFCED